MCLFRLYNSTISKAGCYAYGWPSIHTSTDCLAGNTRCRTCLMAWPSPIEHAARLWRTISSTICPRNPISDPASWLLARVQARGYAYARRLGLSISCFDRRLESQSRTVQDGLECTEALLLSRDLLWLSFIRRVGRSAVHNLRV